jgi:hypothetical protein
MTRIPCRPRAVSPRSSFSFRRGRNSDAVPSPPPARSCTTEEHGPHRRCFTAPSEWKGKGVRLVFEGVMTDTSVKVKYDVTALLKFGEENLLEVDVRSR